MHVGHEQAEKAHPLDQRLAAHPANRGRYLARGGVVNVGEGNWQPGRIVIVEFDDLAAAKAFYDSPDYAPLKALRQRASTGNVVFVEGV